MNNPPITLEKYTANEQWTLVDTSAGVYIFCPENATGSNCNAGVRLKKKTEFYCDFYNYFQAHFTVYLKRKASYYTLNIIIPTILISIAELSTFTIPVS